MKVNLVGVKVKPESERERRRVGGRESTWVLALEEKERNKLPQNSTKE